MEEIINLLSRIGATMETISVVGIDNQDKFVGCANAIKTVMAKLAEMEQKSNEKEGEVDADGTELYKRKSRWLIKQYLNLYLRNE